MAFKEGFYVNERINRQMKECGVTPKILLRTEQLHTVKNLGSPWRLRGVSAKEAVLMDSLIRPVPMNPPMPAQIRSLPARDRPVYSDCRKDALVY